MTADRYRVYGSSEVERVKAKLKATEERCDKLQREVNRLQRQIPKLADDDPTPGLQGAGRSMTDNALCPTCSGEVTGMEETHTTIEAIDPLDAEQTWDLTMASGTGVTLPLGTGGAITIGLSAPEFGASYIDIQIKLQRRLSR